MAMTVPAARDVSPPTSSSRRGIGPGDGKDWGGHDVLVPRAQFDSKADADPAWFQPAAWDAARSDHPGGGRFREKDAPLNVHLRRMRDHHAVLRVQRPDEQARARRKIAQVHAYAAAHDLQESGKSVRGRQVDYLTVTLPTIPG